MKHSGTQTKHGFERSLRERDGRLQDNWYVACQSSSLRAQSPLKRVIYDQNLVLFRDAEGKPVCLPDYCLHRHTPLSAGKVECGKIVCPYHGWTYDNGGKLVDIPSERAPGCRKGEKRGHKPRPALEQDGFVWVWMGEREPRSDEVPWRIPYRKEDGWTSYVMETEFDNEVVHLVENFLDVPHTVFVHSGWFRDAIEEKMKVDVVTGKGATTFTYHRENDKIGFIDRLINPRREKLRHTDSFFMPNISKVDYLLGEKHGFFINSHCIPVSSLKTHVYTIIAYRFLPGDSLLKPFLNWYTRRVITQDVDIMKLQGGNLPHTEGIRFSSGVADILHQDIKKLREAGSTDPESIDGIQGQKSIEIWV